jgi:hypothetical protein
MDPLGQPVADRAQLSDAFESTEHYCPVIEKAKMPNTHVVIDDYRTLDLLTI